MKKIVTLFFALTLVWSLTACGGQESGNVNSGNSTSTVKTDNETKSDKKKYKNIKADTTPIGVDNISAKMTEYGGELFPFVFCTIHKNGGDIEESIVEVTIEIFDQNNTYIAEETLQTERTLTEGDSETVNTYLHNCLDEKSTDEYLSKCKLKVVAINEIDVKEVQESELLADYMSEIEDSIYNGEYNSAITMLEIAKEEYPDNKELILFEAKMKDELSKKGINMDVSSTETTDTTE